MLDQAWGSSGKAKMSCHLADAHGVTHASASCYPNSGHTAVFGGRKYVFKVLPSPAALNVERGLDIPLYLSPGTGFDPEQLVREWLFSGRPRIVIHERASIVTENHRLRERGGSDSTKHIASTMQGSGAALSDKIMRKEGVPLARVLGEFLSAMEDTGIVSLGRGHKEEWGERVRVIDGMTFRQEVRDALEGGATWLHEGSQGYALSIDHGSHYPNCTSRNCTSMKALDDLGVPPQMMGDVYLNLRTFPIRVGNVVEDGVEVGHSGGFYPDCTELTWEDVARRAGMDEQEVEELAERERTTVTKRVRRVCTFSWIGLRDAVATNGATHICCNFIQYLGMGNATAGNRDDLNAEGRAFIDRLEAESALPVVAIGTGADHDAVLDAAHSSAVPMRVGRSPAAMTAVAAAATLMDRPDDGMPDAFHDRP